MSADCFSDAVLNEQLFCTKQRAYQFQKNETTSDQMLENVDFSTGEAPEVLPQKKSL